MGKEKGKKIVVIGGGTGVFTVLTGLREGGFMNLSAIVTMADDGGSTGILREEFGILPPGDIRRALVALSDSDNKIISELFSYRFKEGKGLTGHNFGNLIITALERITGSFERAIEEVSRILSVRGRVIPVTLQKTRLFARLENEDVIKGETNIDIPAHDGRVKIKKVWLEPEVRINPEARRAIIEADLVIIGPGDLYTSVIPNLLVTGVKESLKKTKAKVVYFANVMTKFGETNNFRASDFSNVLEYYLGSDVLDYVVINKRRPTPKRLADYFEEGASLVQADIDSFDKKPKLIAADLIRVRGFIRHDPKKICAVVGKILNMKKNR